MLVAELAEADAAPALARTYNHPSYEDPWTAVEDYQRVQDYCAEHPDAGRTAVGNALDLPPSRVRGWMHDAMPDPARGIFRAVERGWFDLTYDSERFRGLNVLCAWIYSGGSIAVENFVPYFAVETTPDDLLDRAAAAANVDLSLAREGDDGRAAEYRAADAGSVLGRVLHLLGAPLGEKHPDARIRLPAYLDGAPALLRREFAATYLHNRGVRRGEAGVLGLREERSDVYLDALADLFAAVTDAPVRRSEHNLNCSREATAAVEGWPPVLDDTAAGTSAAADLRQYFDFASVDESR